MPVGRYRMKEPSIAMFQENGQYVALTVPAGALIRVGGVVFDSNLLVNVTWMHKEVMMFTEDLRTRSEEIVDGPRS